MSTLEKSPISSGRCQLIFQMHATQNTLFLQECGRKPASYSYINTRHGWRSQTECFSVKNATECFCQYNRPRHAFRCSVSKGRNDRIVELKCWQLVNHQTNKNWAPYKWGEHLPSNELTERSQTGAGRICKFCRKFSGKFYWVPQIGTCCFA